MGEERRGKEERIIPGSQDHLPNYSLCKHIQTSKRERDEKGGKNERQCEGRKEEKETWKERKKGTKEGCKERGKNRRQRGEQEETITQDERNGNENNEEHKYKTQRDGKKIIIKKQVKEKMKR